jgi:glycosyltransferase involved in cell wall biosynthesis
VAVNNPRRIVMIGTSFETHGGISSVVNAYRAAGFFARWPVDYVQTHCDGGYFAKWSCAIGAFFSMLFLVVRHRSAVLHVHAASRASFWRKAVLMAVARAAGWPIIFHLHGGGFAQFYERECSPLQRRIVRRFLDEAACIITVSERWQAWMRTVTSNPRITTIPNPVVMPQAAPAERTGALVAFVGRIEGAKGIFDLIEAVNEVRQTIPNVRAECAGDGDIEAALRHVAIRGLGPNVYFKGWVSPRRREAMLARASVFVLPSHAEGLPMSLLEAMAAGCPVIATRVGGIPDVVTDGVNGLLVPAGDRDALALALHRLLVDRELAARLGREARETIRRRFTAAHALERLDQIYSGLGVKRRAPRRAQAARKLQEICK